MAQPACDASNALSQMDESSSNSEPLFQMRTPDLKELKFSGEGHSAKKVTQVHLIQSCPQCPYQSFLQRAVYGVVGGDEGQMR